MMKRLGIMVLYDRYGIIDKYVDVLLSSLQKEIQELVIVINGTVEKESLERLGGYTEKIFLRKNSGFDAGAYKDLFLHFVPQEIWQSYDEIILMNDTFFGPISPLNLLWDRVEEGTADFWGITRHPELWAGGEKIVESHIQAYFLVLRKRLIMSSCFLEFWEQLSYPNTYQAAVKDFEIRFTIFFEERGFCGRTWMDSYRNLTRAGEEGNPSLVYSCELIKELQVPFFKRKCLRIENAGYAGALKALEYMEQEGRYDTRLIWENLFRLCRQGMFSSVLDYDSLECFYNRYKRIYIYGAGIYGQRMAKYFQYRRWAVECFLTSEIEDKKNNCRKYRGMDFDSDDGIVLALGRAAFEEVYHILREKIDAEQLFLLQYY